MALTLEQYASYLDTRHDLTWPAAPTVKAPKARPHIVRLPGIRAISWSIYGTLLAIAEGEFKLEHPKDFVMDLALDKTIQEFKMWTSMSRKPGQPADYLRSIYSKTIMEVQGIGTGGERYPEIQTDLIWEAIVKKLLQKDYKFDQGFFGSQNEFAKKIAYFFHASLQGVGTFPTVAQTLAWAESAGLTQTLLADGQHFTCLQLKRALLADEAPVNLDSLIPPSKRVISYDLRCKKPADRLFRQTLETLQRQGIQPHEVLHVGARIQQDIAPARRVGMRTALFAGDKLALQATAEQIKDASTRPDLLLTELEQIASALGG